MATLSHKDWLRLHEVLLHLHSSPDLNRLSANVFLGLREFFSYDAGSIQDDRGGVRHIPWWRGDTALWQSTVPTDVQNPPPGRRIMPSWGPDFLPFRESFFAVSAERHPHTEYYRRTGDGTARRLSEIVPLRQLRQTTFFNEISRPLNLVHQLTIYMPLPSVGTLTMAAVRGGRTDFSERDRLVLELLRPHLAAAWHRALRAEKREAGLRQLAAPATTPQEAAVQRDALGRLGLTLREADVLSWLCQGKSNAEIAAILAIRPGTVKTHVEHILAKLGCETRAAATRMALETLQQRLRR